MVLLVGAPALKLRVPRGFHPITRPKGFLGALHLPLLFTGYCGGRIGVEGGTFPGQRMGPVDGIFRETEIDKQTNKTYKFGLLALP